MAAADAALSGSLADIPAPPLLRMVARSRRTGTLSVVGGAQRLVVCFEDGAVTLAGAGDLAGVRAALTATGAVSPEAWDDALAAADHDAPAAGEGTRMLDLLVERGRISRDVLDGAFYDLAVNTVFELLLPSQGEFRFDAAVDHPLAGSLRFDVDLLLKDATQRLETWRLIADVLPSTTVIVRIAAQLPLGVEEVVVSRDEWPVLAAIDGARDVAAIINHTGLSAFGVCGVLHRLITAGIAETVLELPD